MDPTTRQAKREVCLLKMDGDKFTFVKYLPYPYFVPAPLCELRRVSRRTTGAGGRGVPRTTGCRAAAMPG